MPFYRLFGITIETDLPLPAPHADVREADLMVVSRAARPVPDAPPTGSIILDAQVGTTRFYVARSDGGYGIRFPGWCDAWFDPSLRQIELVPDNEEARPLLPLFLSGNVLATVLTLSGECVLHASAVEIDGRALAFVGAAGMGKSTLAAIMCAAHARLLTDDLLRLVEVPGGFSCLSGTAEIRLREGTSSLAATLSGVERPSADGRTGVVMNETNRSVPLGTIVFPRQSRTATTLAATHLTSSEALMELTRYPRMFGWLAPEVLEQTFRWNSRLARKIPTYRVVIPWGPPFTPGVATKLAALLERGDETAGC